VERFVSQVRRDLGAANPESVRGGGVACPFPKPMTCLADRTARWCWFMDLLSCSLVSIRVNIVSLSGAGFSDIIYACTLLLAL
jgi:hypothetical protein